MDFLVLSDNFVEQKRSLDTHCSCPLFLLHTAVNILIQLVWGVMPSLRSHFGLVSTWPIFPTRRFPNNIFLICPFNKFFFKLWLYNMLVNIDINWTISNLQVFWLRNISREPRVREHIARWVCWRVYPWLFFQWMEPGWIIFLYYWLLLVVLLHIVVKFLFRRGFKEVFVLLTMLILKYFWLFLAVLQPICVFDVVFLVWLLLRSFLHIVHQLQTWWIFFQSGLVALIVGIHCSIIAFFVPSHN